MDILCKVTTLGLVPMYGSDYDQKNRLRVGSVVNCSISYPRNYEHHKKFFALVRLTYQNLPELTQLAMNIRSEEDMLTCIKLDLGLATTVWYGRKQVVIPGSISFAAMGQKEFEVFYNRAIDLVLGLYLRGTSRKELIEEIENFK